VEGVSTDTAASLLIAAGDDPERLKNEAAFAHLCAGLPRFRPLQARPSATASTVTATAMPTESPLRGRSLCRMSHDERTRTYDVARRTKEGKTKKEILRCLKL
jgi:transposase